MEKIDKDSFVNSSWTANIESMFLINGDIKDIEAGSFIVRSLG